MIKYGNNPSNINNHKIRNERKRKTLNQNYRASIFEKWLKIIYSLCFLVIGEGMMITAKDKDHSSFNLG